jgi:hypothetical protein
LLFARPSSHALCQTCPTHLLGGFYFRPWHSATLESDRGGASRHSCAVCFMMRSSGAFRSGYRLNQRRGSARSHLEMLGIGGCRRHQTAQSNYLRPQTVRTCSHVVLGQGPPSGMHIGNLLTPASSIPKCNGSTPSSEESLWRDARAASLQPALERCVE